MVGTHPITGDLFDLVMMADNGLPLTLQGGVALAEAQGEAAIGLLDVGGAGGQVLAVSDLGSLDLYNPSEGERDNLDFLRNLDMAYLGEHELSFIGSMMCNLWVVVTWRP